MPQSFVSLHVHVVFSTRRRQLLITSELLPRLFDYIGGILRPEGSLLIAAGGMPDHVHLLVSLGKENSLADTLRRIKTNTSRWIHETFPHRREFGWQAGYGAFSVSFSSLDRVKRYVVNQAEHHRTRTFQEEFLALLRRHNLDFDEQYLWD